MRQERQDRYFVPLKERQQLLVVGTDLGDAMAVIRKTESSLTLEECLICSVSLFFEVRSRLTFLPGISPT